MLPISNPEIRTSPGPGQVAGCSGRMAIADAWIHVICLRDWPMKKVAAVADEKEAGRDSRACFMYVVCSSRSLREISFAFILLNRHTHKIILFILLSVVVQALVPSPCVAIAWENEETPRGREGAKGSPSDSNR